MRLWWLSFADPERPEGAQFLGCAVIEAHGAIEASQVCWALGINPGGEVASAAIDMDIPKEWRNRLLSLSDVEELDRALGGEGVAERW